MTDHDINVLLSGDLVGDCPYPVQQTRLYPALKAAVHRAVVGKTFGQLVPLVAGSHAEDNRVQRVSWLDAFSAGGFGWVVFLNSWLYLVPQLVWYLPNRWQCFSLLCFLSHLRLLTDKVHRWFIGKIVRFEIVSKKLLLDFCILRVKPDGP